MVAEKPKRKNSAVPKGTPSDIQAVRDVYEKGLTFDGNVRTKAGKARQASSSRRPPAMA